MALPIIQIEDSFQKGEEKEKEDQDSKPDIEGEDNALEMSEDFEGKMHDGEQEKKGLVLPLANLLRNVIGQSNNGWYFHLMKHILKSHCSTTE